jgi:hypothetical protein
MFMFDLLRSGDDADAFGERFVDKLVPISV